MSNRQNEQDTFHFRYEGFYSKGEERMGTFDVESASWAEPCNHSWIWQLCGDGISEQLQKIQKECSGHVATVP